MLCAAGFKPHDGASGHAVSRLPVAYSADASCKQPVISGVNESAAAARLHTPCARVLKSLLAAACCQAGSSHMCTRVLLM
jgi:hypothetical protein